MESTLTVGRGHRTVRVRAGLQRRQYPELRVSAPVLTAAGLEPGDRVRVRTVGARIIIERATAEDRTPSSPGGQTRRRRDATAGRKAEEHPMSNRGSPGRLPRQRKGRT